MGSELAHITLVQFEDFTDNTLTTTTVLDVYVKPEGSSMDSLKDSIHHSSLSYSFNNCIVFPLTVYRINPELEDERRGLISLVRRFGLFIDGLF
jgi:hypothetical protein